MTTRITQVDGETEKVATLRIEGSLRLADAELLESTSFLGGNNNGSLEQKDFTRASSTVASS